MVSKGKQFVYIFWLPKSIPVQSLNNKNSLNVKYLFDYCGLKHSENDLLIKYMKFNYNIISKQFRKISV